MEGLAQAHGYPTPHIIQPIGHHTHTIIFLHGRGSSGLELADDLGSSKVSGPPGANIFSQLPHIKWVFPTAKPRFSTVFKEEMTEWFDIYSLSDPSENSELQIEGLRQAVMYLKGLLEVEIEVVRDPKRVILAGISQGEATALIVLLTERHELGGFIGYSGWLPFAHLIQNESLEHLSEVVQYLNALLDLNPEPETYTNSNHGTPGLIGHGRDDAYVDPKLGLQMRDIITKLGYNIDWHEYNGADQEGHWFKEPEALDDIIDFVQKTQ